MFRNPRENASQSTMMPLKPSTGRPPTPPDGDRTRHKNIPAALATRSSPKPLTPRPNSKANMASLERQSTKKVAYAKGLGKPNSSILSFFKKVDHPDKDDSIFLSQGPQVSDNPLRPRLSNADILDPRVDNICGGEEGVEDCRYNEIDGPLKKRKILDESTSSEQGSYIESAALDGLNTHSRGISAPSEQASTPPPTASSRAMTKKIRRKGPFLSDSDTEDDLDHNFVQKNMLCRESYELQTEGARQREDKELPCGGANRIFNGLENIPGPKKESTSWDDWGQFDEIDDILDDDEFAGGEEFIERKWMEEQARLEAAEDRFFEVGHGGLRKDPSVEAAAAVCPICDASLGGISADQATRHVNGCLDGQPIPLPEPVSEWSAEAKPPGGGSSHFQRKAAIAKPGQANPFGFDSAGTTPSSAFSKLMSGHAEDAAWASAAAAENASRGKPAYQRICPFYKIMPGFFICVDAFRYGSVQGCNAYFLSHFHSDHYVGLTSTWCHGPIYCSKVTANLVKQQLRVDPKWVVALEFEARFEVPGTQGVGVTMIPANHCPGSSLFLFEKTVGRDANPKVQRVLHCGDFRACPAHITHPLLMPHVVDSITGKTNQQKIDVCYLDTTYLNPRYGFPSQDDVIKACADMCVSLKKERAEENDAWEVVKRERAGAGMSKFVHPNLKAEDDSISMEIGSKKRRGRLLVICGTYSIGKERICMGIARALDCKIWAPPGKMKICAALEDPELMSRMTSDPREAQVHMQMLMEIRAETLQDYLNGFKPHFSRIVGFRPSGWNYRPPSSRFIDSPSIPTVLNSANWHSRYTMAELVPQRGSTREASCFGVPYSEHSSFRELTMFVCALRIEKVVPTVNVGSAASRAKMKAWIEKWLAERKKNGCVVIGDGEGEVLW